MLLRGRGYFLNHPRLFLRQKQSPGGRGILLNLLRCLATWYVTGPVLARLGNISTSTMALVKISDWQGESWLMSSVDWKKGFFTATRGRILLLLRRSRRTVKELAEALGLTENAVRSHLTTMQRY